MSKIASFFFLKFHSPRVKVYNTQFLDSPWSNMFVMVCQTYEDFKGCLINTVHKNLAYNWIYFFFLIKEKQSHRRRLFRSIQKRIIYKETEGIPCSRTVSIDWFFDFIYSTNHLPSILESSIIQLLTLNELVSILVRRTRTMLIARSVGPRRNQLIRESRRDSALVPGISVFSSPPLLLG